MTNSNVVKLPGQKRPLSVWILWIGNGLLAVFLVAASLIAEDRGFKGWQAAISGIAGLVISIAAHAMWYGNRRGRNILLGALTVFLGLIIVQSLMMVQRADAVGYGADRADMFRIVLSSVWIFVNYWFLLNKRARVFFA